MAGEQIRLLVVEDVPQVASHMRALLQAQSQIKILDVITAGDRAVGAVSEYKPDVVIVDALLQGKDWENVEAWARRLKKNKAFAAK